MTFKKLISLTLIASLLGACSPNSSNNSPENTAELYWRAILAGDSEAANNLVLAPIELELSQLIQPGANSEVSLGEISIENDTAAIATHLNWVDKEEDVAFDFQTSLALSNDQWKVDADSTQQSFFLRVYELSQSRSSQNTSQQSNDSEPSNTQELNEMLAELEQTTLELQRQQEQPTDEVEAFLELLDEDLQEEIKKHN